MWESEPLPNTESASGRGYVAPNSLAAFPIPVYGGDSILLRGQTRASRRSLRHPGSFLGHPSGKSHEHLELSEFNSDVHARCLFDELNSAPHAASRCGRESDI